jgi:Na+:H+ antiporter, NhaA family
MVNTTQRKLNEFVQSQSAGGVALALATGLVVGKLVGVFGASWLLIRLTGVTLPANSSWAQLLGVSALCGVGFTMSLFIGTLAFQGLDPVLLTQVKIGVLGGSLLAALLGVVLLLTCRPAPNVLGSN